MSAYSNAVLALSPSSYWRFVGTNALTDSGSGGLTLTSVGAPLRARSIVPSEGVIEDAAFKLDSLQYFTAGDNYEFPGEINWTMMLWMRPDSGLFGTDFHRLLEKRDTGGTFPGWLIYGSGTNNLTFDIDFGATVEGLTTAGVITQGAPHFIVYTWVDATSTLTLYMDGFEVDTKSSWTTAPGMPASGTAPFTIGASSSGGNGFIGMIDDVAVWSGTALTAKQVENLWRTANNMFRPVMSSRGTSW